VAAYPYASRRLSDSSTDGVNGSQLFATHTEVNKLGTRMTNVEAVVNDMTAGNGVKYYRVKSVMWPMVAWLTMRLTFSSLQVS